MIKYQLVPASELAMDLPVRNQALVPVNVLVMGLSVRNHDLIPASAN